MPEDNVSEELILDVIQKARDCAFKEGMVDLRLCYSSKARPENRRFIRQNNIRQEEILSAISCLRIEDYSETSREIGKTDAYVFGIVFDDLLAYFKFTFRSGVLVISLHEPDREMNFPYRRRKSK